MWITILPLDLAPGLFMQINWVQVGYLFHFTCAPDKHGLSQKFVFVEIFGKYVTPRKLTLRRVGKLNFWKSKIG